VSAASILAKVWRDREMNALASLYPQYGFEGHKGYGSKKHIEVIRQYGYCDIHRKSFKLKALQATLF
jgi:ribonuclease HII